MIKLLIAGPREFTDRIQKQVKDYPDIRIISITTEPSLTIEALESGTVNADALLLGFPDEKIKLMIDIATRHEVQSVIFVSVDNLSVGYQKWAMYKLKLAREGRELDNIVKLFHESPDLLRSVPVSNEDNETSILNRYEKDERETKDSKARVNEVRRREMTNRAVPVKRKVITVFGQKGGVGKTVIAISMAESLSHLTNLSVVVLDLDMNRPYGDVIRHFGNVGPAKDQLICNSVREGHYNGPIPQEKTLAAWQKFPRENRGDRQVVEHYLIKKQKNLFYLPPMRILTEAQEITYDLIVNVISTLQKHFDVIIIDGGNTLNDPTLSAIENADELLIVSTAEYGVLDNLADFVVNTVKSNVINGDPVINTVINKIPAKIEFNIKEEVPKITGGYPLIAQFPYDQLLYEKVANRIRVPHLGDESTPFLEEMENLLCHIFPREIFGFERRESKVGILKRLFARLGKKKSAQA